MKTIEQKLEQAKRILPRLAKRCRMKNDSEMKPLYYSVLRLFNKYRDDVNKKLNKDIKAKSSSKSRGCYFDSPELKVTSTTYERSKRALESQINNKFNINR